MKKEDMKDNRKSSSSADIKPDRKTRKTLEKKQVEQIRAAENHKKSEAHTQRKERAATLLTLSKQDKKAFLAAEKKAKAESKRERLQQITKQKHAYAAMTAAQKKAYRKEQKRRKRLRRKAKDSYIPFQTLKFTLLAMLAIGLIYAGNLAYGMFIDNSHAFHNTGQALNTPPVSTPVPTATPTESQSTPTATMNPYELLLSQADLDFMENRVNILVLGIDESIERSNWSSFRTDTMILVSVDFETHDVHLISLPRDSYVWIYNKDYRTRINTAFSSGGGYDGNGFEYAMKTVSLLFGGVPVNHYVCFDMTVVKEVVDTIGGLYYDVDIEFTMNGRRTEKGHQHLDGQAVLDYCRERHVDSDIGRTARQRRMIMAIFDEMKNTAQIQDIPAIYSAITGNIYTDLTFEQICSLAAVAMNIGADNIHDRVLEGGFLNIDGTSFWGVNQYKKRDMVKEIFGVSIKVNDDDDVSTLQVLAADKRTVVAQARTAAKTAQAYVDANISFIPHDKLGDFNAQLAVLLEIAGVKNTKDVGPTIEPIRTATIAFNDWFNNTFKPTVESSKATPAPAAPPTPTTTDGGAVPNN